MGLIIKQITELILKRGEKESEQMQKGKLFGMSRSVTVEDPEILYHQVKKMTEDGKYKRENGEACLKKQHAIQLAYEEKNPSAHAPQKCHKYEKLDGTTVLASFE